MDDATQKDYVPQRVEVRAAESWMDRPIKVSLVTDSLRGTNANTFYLDESEARALAAALEAAQRPPVNPETTTNIDGIGKAVVALVPMCENETHAWNLWNYIASDRGALRDALLHAYRPPVSPEEDRLRAQVEAVREAWWSGTEQGDTGLVYTDRIEDAMDAIWDAVGHADWTPRERPPVSPVLDAINDAREVVARGERPSIIIDTDDYPAPERPPVSGEYTHVVNLARASEAADKGLDALIDYLADLPTVEEWRPPVSLEQREALTAIVQAEDEKWDGSNAAEDFSTRVVDAILARFSLPVLDVEKVARWLYGRGRSYSTFGEALDDATALVASLHTLTDEEKNDA